MIFLLSAPGANEWIVILFLIALVIAVPIVSYLAGFKNGKREGEKIQLQKQVDAKG